MTIYFGVVIDEDDSVMLMFLLFADDALFTYDLGLSGRIEDGDYYEDYCDSGVFYEMGDCISLLIYGEGDDD